MKNIEGKNKVGENYMELEIDRDMPDPPRNFYRTRAEAERNRRKGERVYYKKGKGYYKRRPQPREKTLWERLLG